MHTTPKSNNNGLFQNIAIQGDGCKILIISLYNVCSVHRGDAMSTSGGYHEYIGGVQYIGGCSVHQRDTMSTSGGCHEYIGGYHEYTGGCSVHWGYHDTCGGYHDTCGDTMSTLGDTMSALGDIMSTSGGYHDYIRGMFSTSGFSIEIERILSSCSPTCIMISLRCTEHPPLYSWYPPTFIMNPPDVLNIPRYTHDSH